MRGDMKKRTFNRKMGSVIFLFFIIILVFVFCARKTDLEKGIDAMKKSKYDKALKSLSSALSKDSLNAQIHYNLGLVYAHLDSAQKSYHHYLRLVDLGSNLKDDIKLKGILANFLNLEPYPSSPIPMRKYNQFKGAPNLDGELIAVAAARRDVANIYLVQLDGRIIKKITKTGMNNDPDFSPTGNHIVFVSDRDGDEDLYLYNIKTGETEKLIDNTARDFYPSFSPDGKEIVFVSNMDDIYNWEIYKVNVANKQISRLTKNRYWDGFPKFTQDGKSVVFSSRRNGSEDIYIMNKNGGAEKVLYTSPADENDPVFWNGKLYFKSDRDGEWEIYQLNLDDNFLVRLTYNQHPDWNPRISRDGSKLYLSRKIKRYWRLYFINLNQPIPTALITQKINEKISDKIID